MVLNARHQPGDLDGLRENGARHICAMFEGALAVVELAIPFVRDGIQRGDRVVQVTPAANRARTATLVAAVVPDLDARAAEGQYTHVSTEHLLGGSHPTRTDLLRPIVALLGDRRKRRLGRSTVVMAMDWLTDAGLTTTEITDLERRITSAIAGGPDIVVCVYDVHRYGPGQVGAILGAHGASVVGGTVQVTERDGAAVTARERVIASAALLFHEYGVLSVGVDTIIASAQVAKATFYRHFPSKDDLIVAWLRDDRARWFDRVRAHAEAVAETPEDVVPTIFESVAEWLEAEQFRGCPFLNTAAAITDTTHPARAVVRAYFEEIEAYLRTTLTQARYRDAGLLATQLEALLAGAIAVGVARRTSAFALAARTASSRLLADARVS